MIKKAALLNCVLVFVLAFCGCSKMNTSLSVDKTDYTTLINELCDKAGNNEVAFTTRDIDNDGVSELLVTENGVKLSVYATVDGKAKKVGENDFLTGTIRYLYTDNPDYPGVIYFYVSGGLEHYGYVSIYNGQLKVEELWTNDYSGISEIEENIEKVNYISEDKKLIDESLKAYKNNQDIVFTSNVK